jgi:hypothetical protein
LTTEIKTHDINLDELEPELKEGFEKLNSFLHSIHKVHALSCENPRLSPVKHHLKLRSAKGSGSYRKLYAIQSKVGWISPLWIEPCGCVVGMTMCHTVVYDAVKDLRRQLEEKYGLFQLREGDEL